ncbi:sensor histidine kinase [Streptomyces sp. AA1529]|uniref:sensor histidine kinase n=1 Tax=Streptomyces sp. AA1529 TaxID=1203257 RepID=UPI003D75D81F
MRRLPAPRSLRGRLILGLVVLLAVVCTSVGAATVLALRGFLTDRLDEQLTAGRGRFAASLEHEHAPDADNDGDTRGQAEDTLGARIVDGRVVGAAVVKDTDDDRLELTAADRRALVAVPRDGRGHTVSLTGIGDYRVAAWSGDEHDTLLTGLPLHPVEETLHRLEAVEAGVFGLALAATGAVGALWVRRSLLPLERVADTADRVAELPLASGQVDMPPPVPRADPATEVGRVATAINRMLGHVGDALDRRHAVEERLRTFAADAGHELRTPVANVRARAELALRHPGPLPGDVRRSLERVAAESRRMSVLVDELLLLARLDAGRGLEREPVDLTRLLLDAAEDCRTLYPEHRWTLDLPAAPVVVAGDGFRLHQVVSNLLANAGRHTPPGTRVEVVLGRAAREAVLTVTDDGPGIPRELLGQVFHRFTRGEAGRSREQGSTGLGLAIVDAVVSAHGGTAGVESRPGRTRFRITLPAESPGRPAADD